MHENVWWFCFLLLNGMKLTGADEFNVCSNITSKAGIPEVTFCKNTEIANRAVIINGYFAHSISEAINCSCKITTSNSTTLTFSHPGGLNVPSEISQGCGSEITVTNNTGCGFNVACQISGSINIGKDGYLNVVLAKKNESADTRYCAYITQGNGNDRINVVCSNNTEEVATGMKPTSATTQCPEQETTTGQLTSTPEVIPKTVIDVRFTSTTTEYPTHQTHQLRSSSPSKQVIPSSGTSTFTYTNDISDNLTNGKDIQTQTDYDKILYYSVGGGCGFVVFVNIILITVVLCQRCSSAKSQQRGTNDEDEDDELKYNVLYISSDKDHEKASRSVDQLSFSVGADANYNTVDIDHIPKCLNQETRMDNYSISDISKQGKSENALIPTISEYNDHTGTEYVKHVTAPSRKGCEYAVVKKQGENTPSLFVEETSSVVVDQKYSVCSAYAVFNIPWNKKPSDKIPVITKTTAISREQSETNISKTMKNVLADDNNSTHRNNRVDSHNYTEIDLPE